MASTQRLPTFSIMALLVSLPLAGCATDDADALKIPGAPEEVWGGGTIIGFVINAESAPIANAMAAATNHPPALTDAAGRFVLRDLPAGEHRVEVQAIGYASTVRLVAVQEYEPVEVRFTLEALPVVEPYVELLIFKGFSQCDYMVWVLSGRLGAPCDSGQAKSRFPVQVEKSWQFHVTEMKWKGGVGNYDSFRLFASDDSDCASASPCYGLVYGRGYARLEGEPGKTELVKHYDPWMDGRGIPYPENMSFPMIVNGQWIGTLQPELNGEPCQIVMRTVAGSGYKPGCLGVGVATGIPYDLYVSLFHSMQPEDRGPCCPATKYTALPDS